MAYHEVSLPYLTCPRCLHRLDLQKDGHGLSHVERHMAECDEPQQAEGFVEASELAGHVSHDHPDDWREWLTDPKYLQATVKGDETKVTQ